MSLTIAVARERAAGERRVALVPETAKKFAALGAALQLEQSAGAASHILDSDYPQVKIAENLEKTYAGAGMIFRITPPTLEEIQAMPDGVVLTGLLRPFEDKERLAALNAKKITAFAMELLPRITRAQSMDVLSSQSTCSGYKSALIAAGYAAKFFPMLTTAAGTMRPARILVIGAGVAGLQAIATCKRLGAIVDAYDVRAAAKEEVESLGAKFVDTGVHADGSGGYARELTAEEKAQQAEKLAQALANVDVVITTAAVPGKKAPIIVTEDMVKRMRFGAVIVDMAAEMGGNCPLTKPNEEVVVHDVLIYGPVNLPSHMPTHASELFARNLLNFWSPFIKEGALTIDWEDEVIQGALLCKDGETKHAMVKSVLGV